MKTLFKNADKILKEQMDKTLVGFKTLHLDFYSTYKANRIIIDPGHVATEIKSVITNAADSAFLAGATILIKELNVTAVTNAQGAYQLKPVIAGTYTIIITKTSFTENQQAGFKIKLGQVNQLDIALTPVV